MVGGDNNDKGNVDSNSFAKTICSICYENLKPLVEDLQSISVCGHVFHELCLQQWFEYCPNVKKRSCPICKQTCTNANVGRLYFQSVGDPNEQSLSQKPRDYEENPDELRREVGRLEGKVVGMSSILEQQQKEFKEVKDQLLTCNEQLKVEVAMKKEAVAQTATSQQLLRIKSQELDKSTLECMTLRERNMALAKELAALKLASDLDLAEDDIMKLASLGNDVGSKATYDVLKKSLVIRNKSYKELMAKCNNLGRGEARCLHKLEKANDKIKKLKARVQELETAFEIKENETLRFLKDGTPDDSLPGRTNDVNNGQEKIHSLVNEDENITRCSTFVRGFSDEPVSCADNIASIPDVCLIQKNEVEMLNCGEKDGVSCSVSMTKRRKLDHDSKLHVAMDDDDVICYGDINPVQPSLHIKNEIKPSVSVSQPGDHCFSGGLLGPDGTNWHLGKWCKKAQNRGSNPKSGDLIAVGADGRGGQIKVMRPLDQSLEIKDTSSWAKKGKLGTKPIKRHLQIEHFFKKSGQ